MMRAHSQVGALAPAYGNNVFLLRGEQENTDGDYTEVVMLSHEIVAIVGNQLSFKGVVTWTQKRGRANPPRPTPAGRHGRRNAAYRAPDATTELEAERALRNRLRLRINGVSCSLRCGRRAEEAITIARRTPGRHPAPLLPTCTTWDSFQPAGHDLPDWPAWCFVPSRLGTPSPACRRRHRRPPPERAGDYRHSAHWPPGRYTQGIYQFDDVLLTPRRHAAGRYPAGASLPAPVQ